MSVSNGPSIVTSGLVLSLDAADKNSYPGSGTTWRDLSNVSGNATLLNGPTYSSANQGSIVFDGVDDYFTYPTITFSNSSFTIEMFGNITGVLDGSNRRSIFGNGTFAGEFAGTSTYFNNLTVNSVNTYFSFEFGSAGSIVIGQNFHWVYTFDFTSKNIFMYLNGKSITTANTLLTSYTNISATFTRFGAWSSIRYYLGNLYIGRMYNRYLSSTEVLQNYSSTKTRFGL